MGMQFFEKIVASPVRGENRMCSHPRTGDATDEKIVEKNREKFNELNFFATKSGTSSEGGYACDFHRALAMRQFQKNRITIANKKSVV